MAKATGTTSVYIEKEIKEAFTAMAADFGLSSHRELFRFLTTMWKQGLLLVVNKPVKECLVAAAEEKIVRMAKKAAQEETNYTLYQKGFINDPYER